MHVLNKILVRISLVPGAGENLTREDLVRCIREYAEDQTAPYQGIVFDDRDTETAGGWKDQYPENVLLGSESLEQIIALLERTREAHHAILIDELQRMGDMGNLSILDFAKKFWKECREGCVNNTDDSYRLFTAAYYLCRAARILNGNYETESGFYDTDDESAALGQSTLDKVCGAPDEWALVLFDHHF